MNPEVSLVFCFLFPSVATNRNPCETCWVLCSLFGRCCSSISWHFATACSNRCQMKSCIYSEMLLSCLLSKYLDSGRLLTFSPESKKEFFVLPAKSVAVGGKESPRGEVSEHKPCSVSPENHTERSLFPFRYNNAKLVCCYCITQLTTSSPRKTIELPFHIKATLEPGRY